MSIILAQTTMIVGCAMQQLPTDTTLKAYYGLVIYKSILKSLIALVIWIYYFKNRL